MNFFWLSQRPITSFHECTIHILNADGKSSLYVDKQTKFHHLEKKHKKDLRGHKSQKQFAHKTTISICHFQSHWCGRFKLRVLNCVNLVHFTSIRCPWIFLLHNRFSQFIIMILTWRIKNYPSLESKVWGKRNKLTFHNTKSDNCTC